MAVANDQGLSRCQQAADEELLSGNIRAKGVQ